jgi:hypothetical protein
MQLGVSMCHKCHRCYKIRRLIFLFPVTHVSSKCHLSVTGATQNCPFAPPDIFISADACVITETNNRRISRRAREAERPEAVI